MQSEIPAGPTPTPGRGEDTVRRLEAAHGSRPPRADEPPEAEPLEGERLFRATFERAVIGIAHFSPGGRWLRANQRLCDLLGYDREELAARTSQDLTHPDDRAAAIAYGGRLLAGEIDEYELDKRFIRKDGAPVWVHVAVALVRTPAGAPDYFITMVQDITARKRLEQERAQLLARERAARAEAEAALARARAGEARAAERAEQLRAILETMADGVVVLDQDGRLIHTNRAYRALLAVECAPGFESLTTFERTSLLGLRDAATGAPLPFAETPVGRALRGEVVAGPEADLRVRALDGRELEAHSSAAPLRDGDGRLAGAVVVVRDMTERNRLAREREAARTQAEQQAEQLDRIFEAAADGLLVYDPEGRLVRTNPAARRILGLDAVPPGLQPLPARERLALYAARGEQGRPLPPEEWPFMRALRAAVGTGTEAGDLRLRAQDGREIELHVAAAPLRDREGHLVGAVSVIHDQTERNRLAREREAARTQAERQAEQLDRIFEATADGLIVYDPHGRLARTNVAARRILGLDAAPPGYSEVPLLERLARYATRDELGRPIPPEELPFMGVLSGEVENGTETSTTTEAGAQTRDLWMRTLDGREIELTFTVAPLRDREGHLVGAVSAFRDLTEHNRLEREREAARTDELAAREASRRLEQFLATAAHDLRTPLTTTIGYLALAQRQTERLAAVVAQVVAPEARPDLSRPVAAMRDRLEEAEKSADRLARLLSLLFDTAAIRADKLELHRAPCDLAALVREQVEALRVAAPDRTITLHAPAAGAPIPVEADADRIGQVLTNYVTNALKYSSPDQSVDVSVAVRAGRARVAVRDHGPGIPKQERARVWELFHRASGVAAQDEAQGGSLGLGLHISRAIVEAHGGRVGVASAVGEGSTFWFALPLAGQRSAPRSGPAGAVP